MPVNPNTRQQTIEREKRLMRQENPAAQAARSAALEAQRRRQQTVEREQRLQRQETAARQRTQATAWQSYRQGERDSDASIVTPRLSSTTVGHRHTLEPMRVSIQRASGRETILTLSPGERDLKRERALLGNATLRSLNRKVQDQPNMLDGISSVRMLDKFLGMWMSEWGRKRGNELEALRVIHLLRPTKAEPFQQPMTKENYYDALEKYGIALDSEAQNEFDIAALQNIYEGTQATAQALWRLYEEGKLASFTNGATFKSADELFLAIIGSVKIKFVDEETDYGAKVSGQDITVYPYAEASTPKFEWNIVHEFGHVLAYRMFGYYVQGEVASFLNLSAPYDANEEYKLVPNPDYDPSKPSDEFSNPKQIYVRADLGMPNLRDQGGIFPQNHTPTFDEAWADMFLYWVYGAFDDSKIGSAKRNGITRIMTSVLNTQIGLFLGSKLMDTITGETTGTIISNGVNVRESPGGSPFGNQLNQGAIVKIVGWWQIGGDRWILIVTPDGRVAWVFNDYVKFSGDVPELSSSDIAQYTGRQ